MNQSLLNHPIIGYLLGCLMVMFMLGFEQWRAHEAFRPLIAEGEVKFTVVLDGKEVELSFKPNKYTGIVSPIETDLEYYDTMIKGMKQIVSLHKNEAN